MSRQARSERVGFLALGLLAGALVACSKPEPPADPTKVFLDVVDRNATAVTPPPPPPKVGKLSVFSTPVGGACRIQRFRGKDPVARELSYDADQPRRTIILAIGRELRIFPPIGLQIVARQGDGVTNEQESVVVGFNPDSSVQFGSRTYWASGRESVNEKVPLSVLDGQAAVRFAVQLVALCPEVLR